MQAKASINQKVTVPNGTITTTVVLGPIDVSDIQLLNIVTKTTSALTATTPVITVEISPSETDDVWISTSQTVTASGTEDAVVAGTINTSFLAKRARLVLSHAGFTGGSFDAYIIGRGV